MLNVEGGYDVDVLIFICMVYFQDGIFSVLVGVMFVCYFDLLGEVFEMYGKVVGVLGVIGVIDCDWVVEVCSDVDVFGEICVFVDDLVIVELLLFCNVCFVEFWFNLQGEDFMGLFVGCIVFVVDVEDWFMIMFVYQLCYFGFGVMIVLWSEVVDVDVDVVDFVVVGLGFGDFWDMVSFCIVCMWDIVVCCFDVWVLLFVVCFSYQIFVDWFGIVLMLFDLLYQGLQKLVLVFGEKVLIGFYNIFIVCVVFGMECVVGVEVLVDSGLGDVYVFCGVYFVFVQGYLELILLCDGIWIFECFVVYVVV